jgi:hypothetical protein
MAVPVLKVVATSPLLTFLRNFPHQLKETLLSITGRRLALCATACNTLA